jgi:hypothetical protein
MSASLLERLGVDSVTDAVDAVGDARALLAGSEVDEPSRRAILLALRKRLRPSEPHSLVVAILRALKNVLSSPAGVLSGADLLQVLNEAIELLTVPSLRGDVGRLVTALVVQAGTMEETARLLFRLGLDSNNVRTCLALSTARAQFCWLQRLVREGTLQVLEQAIADTQGEGLVIAFEPLVKAVASRLADESDAVVDCATAVLRLIRDLDVDYSRHLDHLPAALRDLAHRAARPLALSAAKQAATPTASPSPQQKPPPHVSPLATRESSPRSVVANRMAAPASPPSKSSELPSFLEDHTSPRVVSSARESPLVELLGPTLSEVIEGGAISDDDERVSALTSISMILTEADDALIESSSTALVELLAGQVQDASVRIQMAAMGAIEALSRRSGAVITNHIRRVVPTLLSRLADSKAIVRHSTLKALREVMLAAGPWRIAAAATRLLKHRRSLLRDGAVRVIACAVLVGSTDRAKFEGLVESVAPLLSDLNSIVRSDALDLLFLIAFLFGGGSASQLTAESSSHPVASAGSKRLVHILAEKCGIPSSSPVAADVLSKLEPSGTSVSLPHVTPDGFLVMPSDASSRYGGLSGDAGAVKQPATVTPANYLSAPVDGNWKKESHSFQRGQPTAETMRVDRTRSAKGSASSKRPPQTLNGALPFEVAQPRGVSRRTASRRTRADTNGALSVSPTPQADTMFFSDMGPMAISTATIGGGNGHSNLRDSVSSVGSHDGGSSLVSAIQPPSGFAAGVKLLRHPDSPSAKSSPHILAESRDDPEWLRDDEPPSNPASGSTGDFSLSQLLQHPTQRSSAPVSPNLHHVSSPPSSMPSPVRTAPSPSHSTGRVPASVESDQESVVTADTRTGLSSRTGTSTGPGPGTDWDWLGGQVREGGDPSMLVRPAPSESRSLVFEPTEQSPSRGPVPTPQRRAESQSGFKVAGQQGVAIGPAPVGRRMQSASVHGSRTTDGTPSLPEGVDEALPPRRNGGPLRRRVSGEDIALPIPSPRMEQASAEIHVRPRRVVSATAAVASQRAADRALRLRQQQQAVNERLALMGGGGISATAASVGRGNKSIASTPVAGPSGFDVDFEADTAPSWLDEEDEEEDNASSDAGGTKLQPAPGAVQRRPRGASASIAARSKGGVSNPRGRTLSAKTSFTPDAMRSSSRRFDMEEEEDQSWAAPDLGSTIQRGSVTGGGDDRPIRPMRNPEKVFGIAEDSSTVTTADRASDLSSRGSNQRHPPPSVLSLQIGSSTTTNKPSPVSSARTASSNVVGRGERSLPRSRSFKNATRAFAAEEITIEADVEGGGSVSSVEQGFSRSMARPKASPSRGIPSSAVETKYLEFDALTPCPNPTATLDRTVTDLASGDWQREIEGLNNARRLAKFDKEVLVTRLSEVVRNALPAVNSLRSSVAKTAIMMLADIATSVGRPLESELERLVPVLVRKTADTAEFIVVEAQRALTAVIDSCNPPRVLTALLAASQDKAAIVRLHSAAWLAQLAEKLGPRVSSLRQTDDLLKAAFKFASEGREETRHSGKRIYQALLSGGAIPAGTAERVLGHRAAASLKETMSRVDTTTAGGVAAGRASSRRRVRSNSRSDGIPTPIEPPAADPFSEAAIEHLLPSVDRPASGRVSIASSTSSSKVRGKRGRLVAKSDLAAPDPELATILEQLGSGSADWRTRSSALDALLALSERKPAVVRSEALLVMDRIGKRIGDGNSKVASAALHTLRGLISGHALHGKALEQSMPLVIHALGNGVASAQQAIADDSTSLIHLSVAHMDPQVSVSILASALGPANSKVVPVLLNSLAIVVPKAPKKHLQRSVLPKLFPLLDDSKLQVRNAAAALLQTIAKQTGQQAVLRTASALAADIRVIERALGPR